MNAKLATHVLYKLYNDIVASYIPTGGELYNTIVASYYFKINAKLITYVLYKLYTDVSKLLFYRLLHV